MYRRRVSAFEEYDEHDFFQRYRMTKQIAKFLCDSYSASRYGRRDGRGHAITDELMVSASMFTSLFFTCHVHFSLI